MDILPSTHHEAPDVPHAADAELLRACIAKSGLSARQFAMQVLARDERTVRRWLSGQELPQQARAFLERYLAQPATVPRA